MLINLHAVRRGERVLMLVFSHLWGIMWHIGCLMLGRICMVRASCYSRELHG